MKLVCSELSGQNGQRIALACLNTPHSLNALSHEVVLQLGQQLKRWAQDPQIACVLLRGEGAKAFCAGGDVVELATQCCAAPGQVPPLAQQFFADEYRLDYQLHHYPKPVLCWGHGYVLGGGMGLLQGASIRIVTPSSRLAMPEISIGLYPDVGGSWFLARLPGRLGLFLALTASPINASDALELGLADRFLGDDQYSELVEGLCQLNWHHQPQALHQLLHRLEQRCTASRPQPVWTVLRSQIDALLDVASLPEAWHRLVALADQPDSPLSRAARTLRDGCPLSAYLIWEQLKRARYLSLAQVFRMEYALSLNCCASPEFAEGVRARLIDKDQQPRWQWPDLDSIDAALVERHFAPCWAGDHPLADLH